MIHITGYGWSVQIQPVGQASVGGENWSQRLQGLLVVAGFLMVNRESTGWILTYTATKAARTC